MDKINKPFLTLKEAADYIGVSKATMYGYTHRKQIPHSKPGGNIVYFSKLEIDDWIMSNHYDVKNNK